MGKRKKQDKLSSVSDPRLIPRVKQYLESHQNKKMIDISLMAQNLQKMYSDYGRKKKIPFENSVERVVKLLNRTCGRNYTSKLEMKHLQQQRKLGDNTTLSADVSHNQSHNASDITSGSESDSEPSDLELVTYPDRNLMNQSLHSLYKETTSRKFTAKELDTEKHIESAGFFMDTAGDVSNTERPLAKCTMDKNGLSLSKLSARNNRAMSKHRKLPDSALQKTKKHKKEDSDTEAKSLKDAFQNSNVTFADVGGNDKILQDVCKLLIHMKHPQVFEKLGVDPPRGILLHGPPGCGKTLLAHAIAGELDLPFIKIAATEMVSGVSGESEERIRDMFEKAVMNSPCILFIDEIDAITPKRETASKEMERRIVAQLLACMDDLNTRQTSQVLILGATNRPDSLDPALRRAGRFDRELCLGIPDEAARTRILMVLCRSLRLSTGFDFEELARKTPGYVGADLMALCREAAASAVDRVFTKLECDARETNSGLNCDVIPSDITTTVPLIKIANHFSRGNEHEQSTGLVSALKWLKEQPPFTDEQLESIYIELSDFEVALSEVQPSAKREGFATVPDVSWDDVGALTDVREELSLAILAPVRYPEQFKALGLNNPPGILLFGPPGCGKTLLAKAIANESGINFISVKGPELLNMYVGESEKAVRQCFQRARNSAPCVIFFDELDALCPRRSSSADNGASVRVVNQLLTEMDGLETRKQVFIMGATNRPDIIDPAILRPGRLDKTLYVGLPSPSGRFEILKTITKNGMKPLVADDVNLESLAFDSKCEGYTGADLAALVHEAAIVALKELIGHSFTEGTRNTTFNDNGQVIVADKHFQAALIKIKPSVNKADQQRYEDYLAFKHKL